VIRNTNTDKIKNPGFSRLTRVFRLTLLLLSFASFAFSQDNRSLKVKTKTELNPVLREISGMVYSNGKIYAINDSGNRNQIHIMDPVSADILKTVRLAGSENFDWEEITSYNNTLYIGDFGNNFGNRDKLLVYKVPVAKIDANEDFTEKIHFSYKKQTSFRMSDYKKHSWDCEAMIVDSSGIWLFSKDWKDRTCRLYLMEDDSRKEQSLTAIDSLKLDYLVTGAYYDSQTQKQLLCGYEGKHTYITVFEDINKPTLSANYRSYRVVGLEYAQVESILVMDNIIYLASERSGDNQAIYSLIFE